MSRVKEFDVDAACDAALELFWRQGYEATSVNDLVAALGIGKASLYATFGTKHDLYLTALNRYIARGNERFVEDFAGPGPALAGVRRLIERYLAEILDESGRDGCFVVNAAMEMMPKDPEVARAVERSWDALELALRMALSRAKAQGELDAATDPEALARFLLTVLQGMRVLSKGPDPAPRAKATAEQALAVLDAARSR
ncbi:TetR/AcrR family transcriptional regulator [Amycolatopsis regifaucium]|uniref:TetR family transcriptional regulator n=1 Tax=Amycolatopsis regifaucium TaxID=546365 RepID=A0A154M439_9PSEU|nr:TetR/AcrR family transcriptional regulator [Amycolatopsis regifaucium]KZB79385.1 TetR family transcriptional regulator [Amycolatopsis regifaucium]OKA07567.1 TetR family transcriptional regulator [Amycolatopsis regifaucium]SFH08133.1 transcriptional regulator, TetR family [Amycolatopsis regifaucium]